jgi:AcrR family transcriptional regulator
MPISGTNTAIFLLLARRSYWTGGYAVPTLFKAQNGLEILQKDLRAGGLSEYAGAMAKRSRDSPERSGRRPYKLLARAESQQRTRDALLDAAIDEFSGEGWQRTSLEALARRAGVTKQTLLRHFGSKDGLLEATIRRTSEIVRPPAPTGDVPGAVRNLMVHYERWGDLVLRVLAEEHRIPLVRKGTDRGRHVHQEWVERTFEPQLSNLGDDQARKLRMAQLVAVCDVYVWKVLRRDMKLGVAQAEIALIGLIEGLFAQEQ